jgi:hypothetical protein
VLASRRLWERGHRGRKLVYSQPPRYTSDESGWSALAGTPPTERAELVFAFARMRRPKKAAPGRCKQSEVLKHPRLPGKALPPATSPSSDSAKSNSAGGSGASLVGFGLVDNSFGLVANAPEACRPDIASSPPRSLAKTGRRIPNSGTKLPSRWDCLFPLLALHGAPPPSPMEPPPHKLVLSLPTHPTRVVRRSSPHMRIPLSWERAPVPCRVHAWGAFSRRATHGVLAFGTLSDACLCNTPRRYSDTCSWFLNHPVHAWWASVHHHATHGAAAFGVLSFPAAAPVQHTPARASPAHTLHLAQSGSPRVVRVHASLSFARGSRIRCIERHLPLCR